MSSAYSHVTIFISLPLLPPGRGKVLFSVCFVSLHLGGGGGGGVYPVPGLDGGGVPHPRSGWRGGYPIPGLDGGYPQPGLDGVPPSITGWGTPTIPPSLDGVPPLPPIRQSSIASTCYAAVGMPLAFTQEDILISTDIILLPPASEGWGG